VARRRFQEGQVYKKSKNWIGRWREDIVEANGKVRRIRRARVIGSVRELPTKPLARRRLQQFLALINDPAYRPDRNLTEFPADRGSVAVQISTINAMSDPGCTFCRALGDLGLDPIGSACVRHTDFP